MSSFKFTNAAVHDLSEIWDYTVKIWSDKQAEKYHTLIIGTCSEIAKGTQTGTAYFDVYPGLLGQKIAKHIIFYRVMEDQSIQIARILHQKMDLRDKLKK